jgi:RES domain-containing protein
MTVIRLCKQKYPDLDGMGASITGGRWNSPGRRVIYTASCGALAALEYMVHMTRLPAKMLLTRIEVPDDLAIKEIDSLPDDPAAFRQLGDKWLQEEETVGLRVLSVLVPRQWNVLLNPLHPLYGNVRRISAQDFEFDSRLLSSVPAS